MLSWYRLFGVSFVCRASSVFARGAHASGSFPKYEDPNINPQNTIIRIMGTSKMVPRILGSPQVTDPCIPSL